MTIATTDLSTLAPFDRATAVSLGRVEYRRFAALLDTLEPADWLRPTDCDGWTVRDLVGHVVGSLQDCRSLRAFAARQRGVAERSKETGELEVDAMTALQVESVAGLDVDDLVARMHELVDPAAEGRLRLPRLIARAVKIPVDLGVMKEKWTLDYLLGTILTRDIWLHRVADVARAIDRPPELDAAHDARIVADVASEWIRRHGRPVELTLTGPAGGRYVAGDVTPETPRLELDAIQFCRILSGRAEPTHPLLGTPVPF